MIGAADVRKFDFNGHQVAQFGSGDFIGGTIAHDGTGLYLAGRTGAMFDYNYRVWKYNFSGTLLWEKALALRSGALAVDSSGVYILIPGDSMREPRLEKYTKNGYLIWQGSFGKSLGSYGVTVRDGTAYVAGAAFGASGDDTNSFVAKFSAIRPPQLQSLGTIDGSAATATLRHDPSVPRVFATVQNVVTGNQISSVEFSPQYHPQEMVVLPDRNGNGAPEIAVLGVHETTGEVVAEIRDSRSGALLNTVAFNKTYVPRHFAVVPAIDSSHHPGLAVLGNSNVDRTLRVEVKDSVTGSSVSKLDFVHSDLGEPYADFRVLPDVNRNGSPELAVLHINTFLNASRVAIKDSLTGEDISEFSFDDYYCVKDIVVVPDMNGNGSVELATLLKGCWQGRDGVKVDIYDALTGQSQSRLWYSKYTNPVALIVAPDLNGNGSPELGVMALNVANGEDVLSFKDLLTQRSIRHIVFQRDGYKHRGLTLIPDTNSNTSADVAQLQENRLDGKLRVLIKDAGTGAFIRYVQ